MTSTLNSARSLTQLLHSLHLTNQLNVSAWLASIGCEQVAMRVVANASHLTAVTALAGCYCGLKLIALPTTAVCICANVCWLTVGLASV